MENASSFPLRKFTIITLSMALVGSIVGLLYQSIFLYITPKRYESRAMIEILPSTQVPLTERDVETQAAILKCGKILKMTTTSLALQNRWNLNEEECIDVLKENLTVHKNPESNVLALRFLHANNVDARDITRAIYENYSSFQSYAKSSKLKDELENMRNNLQKQSDALTEKQKAIALYTTQKNQANSVEQAKPKTIDQLNAEYTALLSDYTKNKTEAEKLETDIQRPIISMHLLEEPTIGNYPVGTDVEEMLTTGIMHGAWTFATASAIFFILIRKEPLAMA